MWEKNFEGLYTHPDMCWLSGPVIPLCWLWVRGKLHQSLQRDPLLPLGKTELGFCSQHMLLSGQKNVVYVTKPKYSIWDSSQTDEDPWILLREDGLHRTTLPGVLIVTETLHKSKGPRLILVPTAVIHALTRNIKGQTLFITPNLNN